MKNYGVYLFDMEDMNEYIAIDYLEDAPDDYTAEEYIEFIEETDDDEEWVQIMRDNIVMSW